MSNINPKVTVDEVWRENKDHSQLRVTSVDLESGDSQSMLVDRASKPEDIYMHLMSSAWLLEEDPPRQLQDKYLERDIEFLKASAKNVPGLKK